MRMRKYRKTEKGKLATSKQNEKYFLEHKEKRIEYMKEYLKKYSVLIRKSGKTKEYQRKTYQRNKEKILLKQKIVDQTKEGKLKRRNRAFIGTCIRNGKLVMRKQCSDCKKLCKTEIHHILYHDPPQLIDIVEVCSVCHTKRDNKLTKF